MKKLETSRRKFLGQSGSLALTLPLAAAIPAAAAEVPLPGKPGVASASDIQRTIPNRTLPTRAIGTATVLASDLPTNGTDCSAILQGHIDSLGTAGGTVIIPWKNTGGNQCVYMINPQANVDGAASYGIMLRSNVRLQFRPGVKLQAITINQNPNMLTDRAYMLYGLQVHDVEIADGWFVGERYTHIYSGIGSGTDEWCMGIQLLGVMGVTIRGSQFSDCTGDGICIGSYNSAHPSDVVLCDVISTGNRRQGVSITAGDSISVYDSEFSYTSGTAPGDGIDIEPQGADSVSNVTIDNCVIRGNAGDGLQMNAANTSITNVNILNCLFSYNYWMGLATQSSGTGAINTGTIYGNAFFQNGYYGLQLGGATTGYTVGGPGSDGSYSNSFANNQVQYNTITYPNQTQTNTEGYVSGKDMNLTSSALQTTSNNLVQWNSYFTP